MEFKVRSSWLSLVFWRMRCEWRREWRRSLLGMFWWFLEPLIYLLAFYTVFGLGFRVGTEGFVAFLLCGLVSWKWFASTLNTATGCIEAHRGLITQVRCPKWVFPAVVFGNNSIKFLVLLAVFLILLPFFGHFPKFSWFHLFWIVLVQGVFILGCSFLLASISPFLPDFKILQGHLLMVLMFSSGLFFDVRELGSPVREWMEWNPVSVMFTAFREALLEGRSPEIFPIMIVVISGVLLAILGIFFLKRWDGRYAKMGMI